MQAKWMRLLILRAIGGGMITGIAAGGCGDDSSGTPAVAGAGGKGGAEAGVGAAGHSVDGCFTNAVGTCCTNDVCFERNGDMVRSNLPAGLADSGVRDSDAGADNDGGVAIVECPKTLRQTFTCTSYGPLVSSNEGQCCYTQTSGTCCGRPLIVDGLARVAPVRSSTDWIGERYPGSAELDPCTASELARAWLSDARLEHASIASFARFTLQALALGAPAVLVADAQRAALDEVSHAQLCFALASRYAGETLGPAPLSMEGAVTPSSLSEAAAATVREGCVSETLASFQVRRQLERARDPHVRAALTRIADDEQRHAELAWRFVRWTLVAGGAPVRDAVERAFRESLERLQNEEVAGMAAVDVEVWHEHGRLTACEERACWLEAAREVIEPCALALLGSAGSVNRC